MHNSQNKKTLQIVLIVLIAVLTLGIGYASISAINLIIDGNATANPNDTNFKVKFLSEDGVTPMIEGSPTNTVQVDSDTTASFNVSTLNGAGQSVTATYRVKNESSGIGASIGLQLTNSNPDYFQVTQKILDNKLQAGEETTVTVKVEMLKTPVTDAVSTNITATLVATPIEDAEASGGEEKEEIRPVPDPYVYTINGSTNKLFIDNEIPNEVVIYDDFNTSSGIFGNPVSLAHIVENGRINKSYVVFEENNNLFYLRGGVDESSLDSRPVYEENISILKSLYGDSWFDFCSYMKESGKDKFRCTSNGWNKSVCEDGYTSVNLVGPPCYCDVSIYNIGSHCYCYQ